MALLKKVGSGVTPASVIKPWKSNAGTGSHIANRAVKSNQSSEEDACVRRLVPGQVVSPESKKVTTCCPAAVALGTSGQFNRQQSNS